MKIESFRAGVWRQQYQFKSFSPTPVNQPWTWEDPRINMLLETASLALARLDSHATLVPNVDAYIRLHVVKEAQTSSHIEGSQTTLNEAVAQEEYIALERRNDWREVRNYIAALNEAVAALPKLPISNRLRKQAHARLRQGTRGQHKQPGAFRTSQNWIGGAGPHDAVFIPPAQEEVPELMGDLEKFWHNDTIAVPHLVRVASATTKLKPFTRFWTGMAALAVCWFRFTSLATACSPSPVFMFPAILSSTKALISMR